MIEDTPKTVGTRGRLYTTKRERRELDHCNGKYGHLTPVVVVVKTVDRTVEWGIYGQIAVFETSLGYYGEIQIPADVRSTLGITEDDSIRLTVKTRGKALADIDQTVTA